MLAEIEACNFADLLFGVEPHLKKDLYPLISRCKELALAEAVMPCTFSFEASFQKEHVRGLNQNIARNIVEYESPRPKDILANVIAKITQ